MFGLFRMPGFLRRFIRRRTKHMPEERALRIKERLSLAYAFAAWNLFGGIIYAMYSGKLAKLNDADKELSQGRQFVKFLHMENVTLHHMKGLNYVEKYDLNKEILLETHNTNEEVSLEESEPKDS